MKICAACGMPAPSITASCGYCSSTFPLSQTAAFSLQRIHDTYQWVAHDGPLAEARYEAGLWHLHSAPVGERLLTLVAIEIDRHLRVGLLDAWLRTIATVVVDPAALSRRASGARDVGFVRNRRDETVLAVRGDGPTGLHLVNRVGEVIALASTFPGRRRGLEVIVTAPEAAPTPVTLGGVVLAIELARAGQLRAVA